MPDWFYTPSDLTPFSARAYARLIASYNAEMWPAQLLALAAGAAVMILLRSADPRRDRLAVALLAAGWCVVGWCFFVLRFSGIHPFGEQIGAAFAAQGLALLIATWRGLPRRTGGRRWQRSLGLALVAGGVALVPMLGALATRSLGGAEIVLLFPDPTVLVTLGAFTVLRARWWAWPVPLAWLALSTLQRWSLGSD